MATTLSLWASRRLPWVRWPRVRRPRVLVAVLCLLAVVAAALGVIRLTATPARGAQASSPARPHQAAAAGPAAGGSAAAVRSQVAVWIVGQVNRDAAIGCDPLMCAALRTHGVAASRLHALAPAASSTPDASVIAVSPAGRAGLSQNAPVLLASLGTGSSQVEVRATAAGDTGGTAGTGGYHSALAADIAARTSAGAQLLHSGRIQVSVQAAGQLRAGQVDSRLLIMLDLLASQRSWRVVAFGGASPGVPLADAPLRQVIVTAAGGGVGGLGPAIAVLRGQRAPYQAAQVSTVQLAGGQPGLRIDFAAPGPLGLLTGSVTK